MAPDRGQWQRIVEQLFWTASLSAGGYFLVRYLIKQMNLDPDAEQKERNSRKSAAILKRLDEVPFKSTPAAEGYERSRTEDLQLNAYEQVILQDLVFPDDIPVSFEDIGGLSSTIEELRESVIYPLTMPGLYSRSSSLLSAPSGVLLYGPPGCGKTMLAKAVAHESGACFINLHISTLTEKWFGDSNKLVNAVFSLARKLEPTIVFIDEIDAVLGTRRAGEHEASGMVKAEFMTHWDGLASSHTTGLPQRILIMGATNRIHDIDDAILRRMPKKLPVTLPNVAQRSKILNLMLKDTIVDHTSFDLDYLVRVMVGLSGSEMKEACRDAAMVPVREMIQAQRKNGARMDQVRPMEVRGMRTEDFFVKGGVQSIQQSIRDHQQGLKQQEERDWVSDSSSPQNEDMQDAHEAVPVD